MKKQPSVDVLLNKCSYKFLKIHKKKPVSESLFDKVAGLKAFNFIKKRTLKLEH